MPGVGNLTAYLFEHTQKLYDLLDHYKHIERFRRINQLGRLRDVFQGAHHNRYEYVFLQLSLISTLCENKDAQLGLSGRRDFCGKINDCRDSPSTAELLQCLVLVNNMGYLEGTFSTSRAWLTILKEDQNFYSHFRRGLANEDRSLLKEVVDNYDYYRFNTLMALFQLQRYKRKGPDIVEFASRLLRVYISDDRSDLHVIQLRKLFRSIRQLAFITLDSHYAPVPFSIDLSSILLNFESILESLFIKNTTYRTALGNLETVLQNTVYLGSDSCINTARASEEVLNELIEYAPSVNGINAIYSKVCPSCNLEDNSTNVREIDWLRERKIIQEYKLNAQDLETLPVPLSNQVRWEIETKEKLGVSRSRIGLLNNSKRNTVKLVIGILTDNNIQSLKVALKSTSEIFRLSKVLPSNSLKREKENNELLLMFLLKSIFGWSKRFILENKNRKDTALFIGRGKGIILEQIDKYLNSSNRYLSADELFEVRQVRNFVEHQNYSGLTIAFVGGTKMFEENRNPGIAEFDGVVIYPTINPSQNFAYIIEAKNFNGGVTQARRQLGNRVQQHLVPELEMTIQDFGNRAAYAELRLR